MWVFRIGHRKHMKNCEGPSSSDDLCCQLPAQYQPQIISVPAMEPSYQGRSISVWQDMSEITAPLQEIWIQKMMMVPQVFWLAVVLRCPLYGLPNPLKLMVNNLLCLCLHARWWCLRLRLSLSVRPSLKLLRCRRRPTPRCSPESIWLTGCNLGMFG